MSLRSILARREASLVLVLLIVIVGVAVATPRFLNPENFDQIFAAITIVTVVAVGQAVVVIAGQVDLSVGSIVGLTAFVVAATSRAAQDLPLIVLFLLAIGLGAACGAINGLAVTFGRVPAIVVTLGTLYVFRGIDFIIAGGGQVNAAELPSEFLDFPAQRLLGIPLPTLLAILVVVLFAAALRWLRPARFLYAVGSSPDAARLAGIPQRSTVFVSFMISGALAGMAGVLYATRYGAVTSSAATGLEFQVIATVVVGGVSILGGSGSIAGVAIAAVLFGVITNALNILNAPSTWIQAISAAAILVAITVDLFIERDRERRGRIARERARQS